MGSALLRLPLPGVRQGGENSKIEAGKRIEGLPQPGQLPRWLADLLPDGPEHGADARRLGGCNGKQPLKPPWLAQIPEQLLHRLPGCQLAPLAAVAEEIEQRGVGLGEGPPGGGPAGVYDRLLAYDQP